MEIKRLNNNQIRCALTEEEIEEMGFSIDEIIGNSDTTQRFMREVLEKVEEQEQIDMDLFSPMVRAELLQDHSMAITFGRISDEERQGMLGKILEMMEQLSGRREGLPVSEEIEGMALEEEPDIDDDDSEIFMEATPLGLECADIEDAVRISKLFLGKTKVPQSSFYKMEGKYYLFMEFEGFLKEEIKPLAFSAVEYDNRRIATAMGIAYVKEHGKCIIPENAICDLMQL